MNVTVPLVDLARQHQLIRDELLKILGEALDTSRFVGGEHVESFEREFAAYCGASHCISLANGTDAISIALEASGVGAGDEVITTALSFFATAEAIARTGATPVFCDIDPRTATLDTARLEALVTARTKAIVPVHLYGRMADIATIMAVAEQHGLVVIEDCAQAAGARCRDSRHAGAQAGTIGAIGCHSFYPTKNLGGIGDGGAVVTDDDDLAKKCRRLANHGGLVRYEHDVVGSNSRLDALQAAVLRLKLPYLDDWNAQRAAVARRYEQRLADAPLELLAPGNGDDHVYHLFIVRVDDRDRIVEGLRRRGIGADSSYPQALPMLNAFAPLGLAAKDYPVAVDHAARSLSLPIYPYLREEEIDAVADVLISEIARK